MNLRTVCRALAVCCGVLVSLGAKPAAFAADESQPLAVVSVASYEKLLTDINCFVDARLMALGGEVAKQVMGIATEPGTLVPAGLDPRRPWGLVFRFDGRNLPCYGFAPVNDLGRLMAGPVAARKLKPPAEGVYQVKTDAETWHVKQVGPWALFAQDPKDLGSVPADPARQLKDLPKSYDLGVRLDLARLPDELRQVAQRWVKEGHQLLLDRQRGESDLSYAVRNAAANQSVGRMAAWVDEGETIEAGLSLDTRTRSLVGDLEIVFRPGSEMAESLASPNRSKSEFTGFFVSDAVASGVWTGEIARMPLYQLLSLFQAASSQLLPLEGNRAMSEFVAAACESLQGETIDGGMAGVIRSGGLTVAIGGSIDDGAAVEAAFKALVESSGQRAGEPVWKLAVARQQDVRFHAIRLPPGKAKEPSPLAQALGDPLEVVVGIGQRRLYLAMGKQPLVLLKQVSRISPSRSPRKQPPVLMSVALTPLVRLLADLDKPDDPGQLARLATLLEQARAKDRVLLTAVPVARGAHLRVEAEEAVLRSLLGLALPPPSQPARAPIPARPVRPGSR